MRVVAYNIRHAQGYDGRISASRIAHVVEGLRPDVVGMSEVWQSRFVLDQPRRLGALLGMQTAFQVNVRYGLYVQGNLALARGPIIAEESMGLPARHEPRGALVTRTAVDGVEMRFVTTHLSLHAATRRAAIAQLADDLPTDLPLVLAGDMNCEVSELEPLRRILNVETDVPLTFPAGHPRLTIDHIMYSNHFRLMSLEAPSTKASDHLPLVADLEYVG